MTGIIHFFFANLTFNLFVLAIILAAVHIMVQRRAFNRQQLVSLLLNYILLLGVGVAGIYNCIMHSVFATYTAHFIGWQPSPFQFEVAMANLGYGITGLLAARSNLGFKTATVISLSCFLLGDAVGHIANMLHTHNFAAGNAGSIFVSDILIPITLLALLLAKRAMSKRK